MGKKPEITELPTRFLMAELGSGKRWKKIVAVAVVGIGAASAGGYYLLKSMEAKQAAAIAGQWGALQGCILGEPLRAGETLTSRVRGIQLTVLATPRDERAKGGDLAWPANCSPAASALSEHADLAATGGAELKASAAALAKALRDDTGAVNDIGKFVEQAWKDAAAAGLKADPQGGASVPRPATSTFGREVLHAPSGLAGEFAISSLKPEEGPQKGLRFLVDDNGLVGGAVLCTSSGPPAALACKRVSTEIAAHTPTLSLLGTIDPDAQPWIFAGDRGQLGIYRPAGTLALSGEQAFGASVVHDGSAYLLLHPAGGKPAELTLTHAPLTGDIPKGRAVLDSGEIDAAADASLVSDWIVARSGAKAHPPLHLVGHKLSEKGEIGPLVDIGDAVSLDAPSREDKQPRFTSCRAGSSIALRVHGSKGDAITFYTGSVWTAPVAVQTRGGVMACRGNEAVITQVTRTTDTDGSHPTVEQSRCSPSGCTPARLAIREMLLGTDVVPQEPNSFTAADVGGKLLLVWSAGPLGGLRARFAAIDRIKSVPDELLVDSREENGQTSITEVRLLPTVEGAILFVNTTSGARLFSVDGAGKFTELHTHA